MALTSQNDQPVGEDGVNKYILSAYLQQERRMADEGDAQFIGCDGNGFPLLAGHGVFVALADETPHLPEFAYPCRTLMRTHAEILPE
jgi:hypothetical protein